MSFAQPIQLNWFDETRAGFETALAKKLNQSKGPSSELNAAIEYALLDGGKRLRAISHASGAKTRPKMYCRDRSG